MVLAYLGIILFLLVGNKVEFIIESPVRKAERAQGSDISVCHRGIQSSYSPGGSKVWHFLNPGKHHLRS